MAKRISPKVRIAIRGFAGRVRQWEELLDVRESELKKLLPGMATRHGKAMAEGQIQMIEIEFLDEPDVNQRFFRVGTDPRGMVMPIAVGTLRGESE